MDKREAYKILEVSENATPKEIKKARDRLALKHHNDKGGSNEEMQKINAAYETLTKGNDNGDDNSDIDEDAIFLMKTKIKNAFDYNNVKMEEMEDETIKHYEEKLRNCKTKADLEKFTSEVVIFIRIYARARDAGYLDKSNKKPPKPSNPTTTGREGAGSESSAPKYQEFTCD
jgi:curved DNA-binding protein CbpA